MTTQINRTLSVAPMMDWTDRHCRYLHRLLSKHALLYTEMVTAPAVIHGDRDRLLGFHEAEHPVALQLGGSDPAQLETATRVGCEYGYGEVNLNVGCPSDRVQSGKFGACLMREPDLVADCVQAMREGSTGAEVTVKCRIGVDDQVPADVLPAFLETVSARGVRSFTIHARMAWLEGLSPKENRDIPPLDYELVHQMKAAFPHLEIVLNGGLATLDQAKEHIDRGLDGVMFGRAAYHQPSDILASADRVLFGGDADSSAHEAVLNMLPYIEAHLAQGGRLNQITRHMLGLFAGRPGARQWRRTLSERAHTEGAGPEVVELALSHVQPIAAE
ncbi:tRNA dihydrouridine(20/20a) synthase DusA [Amylibacter sp. IMCC11727]|uniref:tRNA dihydrouridine(20/20a) synthase DusA n=1 Tax=Amylibacter sp. IMCC11727 TaxID=3039851 RepID=UPI00244E38C7|nr:tRNA dihydrouridine(20/20a) synthase DusA [Amylibacter sp. IMCC11727]WGI21045.1 tRNA dihydrouridine(20/20a) synthase DusA [Amylibacter sp. IMCC11727]